MILHHRPLTAWPGPFTEPRQANPFRATWSDTLQRLDRELYAVQADPATVVLQVAVDEREVRLDGQLRADARPTHPGVILSFDTPQGPLSFPCDTFDGAYYRMKVGWQANVRAITLALEALRKVDRYGVTRRGEQYVGWRQLGAGTMPAAAMTVEDAARLLHDAAPIADCWQALIDQPGLRAAAYRSAARKHHPDAGGDPATFRRLTEARDLLETHAS